MQAWLLLVHGVIIHQIAITATNSPKARNSTNALPISQTRERGAGWDWSDNVGLLGPVDTLNSGEKTRAVGAASHVNPCMPVADC